MSWNQPPVRGGGPVENSDSRVDDQVDSASRFGPWTASISPDERRARLRSLRMATLLLYRSHTNLINALALAEDGGDEWLHRARAELQRLTALHRRHLLSSYVILFRGAHESLR